MAFRDSTQYLSVRPLGATARVMVAQLDCLVCTRERLGPSMAEYDAILLPCHGAWVRHSEGEDVVPDAATAAFFNAGQAYGASHPYGCGDGGLGIRMERSLFRDIVAAHDASALDAQDGRPFAFQTAPISMAVHLAHRLLERRLRLGLADALELEERAVAIADAVIASGVRATGNAPARKKPHDTHRDLAMDLRAVLARRFHEPISVEDLAEEAGVSVYHACRVFRRHVGTSMHQHRDGLRLRAALDRLPDPRTRLIDLAFDLGYSSHSHFGASFRRAFGITPAEYRRRSTGAGTREAEPANHI